MYEKLTKSKLRIQKHGEVFTPKWMVEQMLNNDGIKEDSKRLEKTFLEPSAGEGNFLTAILKRKLKNIEESYSKTLIQFENFSLFALTTIYGIELLEDNTQMCVLNMYDVYKDIYTEVASKFDKKPKDKVLNSAKVIITSNISQGDFLTKKTSDNKAIVFSEWKPLKELNQKTKTIPIIRTEYSLEEMVNCEEKDFGELAQQPFKLEQLTLFDSLDPEIEDISMPKDLRYVKVNITDVYREEMELYEKL